MQGRCAAAATDMYVKRNKQNQIQSKHVPKLSESMK